MKPEIKVDYKTFCDFMFQDKNDAWEVLSRLEKQGNVTIEEYAKEVGYLPLDKILNPEVIAKEDIEDEEIEEPNQNYTVVLVK